MQNHHLELSGTTRQNFPQPPQVFQMMSEEEAPPTPLQNSMNQLGKQLSAYRYLAHP